LISLYFTIQIRITLRFSSPQALIPFLFLPFASALFPTSLTPHQFQNPISMRSDDGQWRCRVPVNKVAIVGGTHGNERIGVHLVTHFTENPELVTRPSFSTSVVLSNTAAVEAIGTGAGRRYVEEDLNRCFSNQRLNSEPCDAESVEMKRARELDMLLGPKHSEKPNSDFIFDLHSTTANTGVLLCYHQHDTFSAALCSFLQSRDPSVSLLLWPAGADLGLLPTVGRGGMTVEIGPMPHSTVNSTLLRRTMQLLQDSLDFIHQANTLQGLPPPPPQPPRVFSSAGSVDFPRDAEGRITGFIHPDLESKGELREGGALRDGDFVFQNLDGTPVPFDRATHVPSLSGQDSELYPVFVNEAAYYEQHKAFIVCNRVS